MGKYIDRIGTKLEGCLLQQHIRKEKKKISKETENIFLALKKPQLVLISLLILSFSIYALKMNKCFRNINLALSAEMAKLIAAKVKFQDFHFEVELGVNGLGMP